MAQDLAQLIATVMPYTKSPQPRLVAMAHACERIEANEIDGDIVECGVWRGGNIILARMLCPQRVCWLYDTYEGMVNRSEWDVSRSGIQVGVGKAAVSLPDVERNFRETKTFDADKLRFVRGAVEVTLLQEDNLPEQIALLRLDTDWYHSTRMELRVLFPRLVAGGVLIIDDYGHWMGAKKAVNEFFNDTFPFTWIDYTAVMMVKPHA